VWEIRKLRARRRGLETELQSNRASPRPYRGTGPKIGPIGGGDPRMRIVEVFGLREKRSVNRHSSLCNANQQIAMGSMKRTHE
jgi:hypothetical protein